MSWVDAALTVLRISSTFANLVHLRDSRPHRRISSTFTSRLNGTPSRFDIAVEFRHDGWLTEGRTVWAYFNDDIDGAAVANAQTLGRVVREHT